MKIDIKKLKEIIKKIEEAYSVEPFDDCSNDSFLCAKDGFELLMKEVNKHKEI